MFGVKYWEFIYILLKENFKSHNNVSTNYTLIIKLDFFLSESQIKSRKLFKIIKKNN